LCAQYEFAEGNIVELNNQAKHAVNNKMKDQYRVHLIFDYVEEDYPLPERKTLQAGDIVYQTRRSLDLEKEVRHYVVEDATPRFIVIGAQVRKCLSLSLSYAHIALTDSPSNRKAAQPPCTNTFLNTRW
jgi:hypothetical protein